VTDVPPPAIWITRLGDGAEGRRLAVKDLFDTAGVRTTYGSPVFADHVPGRTAAAVRRLEDRGWEVVGKANLQEFAYGITSQNPHFGDVPNPRFEGRVAGGSSGGSAAALVTGEADLGLGTDTGGSIRIPAACCEVVGFKPSFGLVPMTGCFPLAPTFDHGGPLARDVAGCAEAMEQLASVEPRPLDDLADVMVGVAWLEHAETEVRDLVARVADLFPRLVAVDLRLPEGVFPAFQHEIAAVHRDLWATHENDYGPNARFKIGRAMGVSDDQAAVAEAARVRYRERFMQALGTVDVVIAPTLPIVPPNADVDELDVRERMTQLTFPLNAVGAPALALPCGRTPDGLPASAQIFARPGADDLVLAVGALLESALGHTPAPREEPATQERGA
jgi:aspartyl-tRNA(Asn)/glutamyl-tRNA(Gln) amidotransferase subunit A